MARRSPVINGLEARHPPRAASPRTNFPDIEEPEDNIKTANGYTRSTLDDLVGINDPTTGNFQKIYWSFADVPIRGDVDIFANCIFGVATSVEINAEGIPLGSPVLVGVSPSNLIRSHGTTCIVPC